jgi:hypothetical protein
MLAALQMALDVPGLSGKERISAEIGYIERQLRIAEAELHKRLKWPRFRELRDSRPWQKIEHI